MIRRTPIQRFRRDETGGALIEFALVLPMLLVFLAVSVEGARLLWSYQTTVAGVRDATRYLSRAETRDLCRDGGSLAAWDERLLEIVRDSRDGSALPPNGITVTSVEATLACPSGAARGGAASVATVTAQLAISFPLGSVLSWQPMTAQVADSTRMLGL